MIVATTLVRRPDSDLVRRPDSDFVRRPDSDFVRRPDSDFGRRPDSDERILRRVGSGAVGPAISISLPRFPISLNCAPITDCAALAPSSTTTSGWIARSSASSHGLHALISDMRGFLWMRRLPRGSHLKCFTALVTYTSWRGMPAASNALSSIAPAGPTNGAP